MSKIRTIDQLMSDFRKDVPDLQPTHYAAVKRYLIDSRNEVTLSKVEKGAVKERGYD